MTRLGVKKTLEYHDVITIFTLSESLRHGENVANMESVVAHKTNQGGNLQVVSVWSGYKWIMDKLLSMLSLFKLSSDWDWEKRMGNGEYPPHNLTFNHKGLL